MGSKYGIWYILDSRGGITKLVKPTERAVRMAWKRIQAQGKPFGIEPAQIVELVPDNPKPEWMTTNYCGQPRLKNQI